VKTTQNLHTAAVITFLETHNKRRAAAPSEHVTISDESDVGEQKRSDYDIQNDLDINRVQVTENNDNPPVPNF
jgi:hypothetical protein